ncbi:MAG: DUF262 domain-containing protein [Chloroflexi bacterium]|nr:DUF262 domain-containing protein [Chloroflexota bacterium]
MERNIEPWPVSSIYFLKGNIDPSPPYQRSPVWSVDQKQLLIDSILRGFDIPQIYLTKAQNPDYQWEVVDGQQRLRAIWEFIDGKYKLSEDADDVNEHVIADMDFADLHPQIKNALNMKALSVVTLKEENDGEIEEMFLRLQNGSSLNSAEKRNAISGDTRDFIHEITQSHRLFTDCVAVANRRYAHDELVAQMLLIEKTGSPCNYTHKQLRPMYENGRRFNKNGAEARKLRRVLNFLQQAFPAEASELTKVNLISLYTIASELLTQFAISRRAKEFGQWFREFEKQRHSDDTAPQENDELYDYTLAVLQRTGSVAAQKIRRETLLKSLFRTLPDLEQLDDQRQFSHEQRLVIFSRSNGFCANPNGNFECVETCTWDNWHADHIYPHSRGGKTTVENGQLLCPSCNIKKSDLAA